MFNISIPISYFFLSRNIWLRDCKYHQSSFYRDEELKLKEANRIAHIVNKYMAMIGLGLRTSNSESCLLTRNFYRTLHFTKHSHRTNLFNSHNVLVRWYFLYFANENLSKASQSWNPDIFQVTCIQIYTFLTLTIESVIYHMCLGNGDKEI